MDAFENERRGMNAKVGGPWDHETVPGTMEYVASNSAFKSPNPMSSKGRNGERGEG
jgi:hypothetical protein